MYKKTTKWRDMLKKYRFMNDLSLKEMAKRIGITEANYIYIENGTRAKPKYETFTALSIEMGIDVEKLKEIYFESYIIENKNRMEN